MTGQRGTVMEGKKKKLSPVKMEIHLRLKWRGKEAFSRTWVGR